VSLSVGPKCGSKLICCSFLLYSFDFTCDDFMAAGDAAEELPQSTRSDLKNVVVVVSECPTSSTALSRFMNHNDCAQDSGCGLEAMQQQLEVCLSSCSFSIGHFADLCLK
jgi:hypothetical protein